MNEHNELRLAQDQNETRLWQTFMFVVSICLLGLFALSGYGCAITTAAYYDSMNKCIASGALFIPGRDSSGICVPGVNRHE